jgi:hypothetical protein
LSKFITVAGLLEQKMRRARFEERSPLALRSRRARKRLYGCRASLYGSPRDPADETSACAFQHRQGGVIVIVTVVPVKLLALRAGCAVQS